jgi:hypothetical protein
LSNLKSRNDFFGVDVRVFIPISNYFDNILTYLGLIGNLVIIINNHLNYIICCINPNDIKIYNYQLHSS